MKTTLLNPSKIIKSCKKFRLKLLQLAIFVLFTNFATAQTIAVTNVATTPVCSGSAVTVTFTATSGTGSSRFTTGTTFIAYLSSSTGGAPYTTLNSFTNTTYTFGSNNSINTGVTGVVTIPQLTVAGANYKIAIGSTSPSFNGSTGAGASSAFTVSTGAVPGTVSGATSVCTGTNSTVLTLSGNTGTIQWQSSNDNITFNNISAATSASYTVTNLTATTYYRVAVTNGSCTATTPSVTMTVNPVSVSGSISGASTVCTGTNSTVLTINGSTGSIQWKSSSDNSTFANIAGATSGSYAAANLTATTYYKAAVTSGACTAASTSSVTMTVSPASVAGSISGAATVCSGTNTTLLTLSGNTGNVQWQSSSDNISFANISGSTSSTYTATNLTATTYYRAVVSSGACSAANTPSLTVTVNPTSVAGSITGATTVCSGTNSTVLTLGTHTGTVQWQSSTDNTTFNSISGATSSSYTVTNLTANTFYRVIVTSGVCSSATTATVTMFVSPTSVAGSITGAATVCSGTNSTLLSLNGSTGTIQWQSSSNNNNNNFSNINLATSSTYTVTNLTSTTYYRAVVSSGACSSATTVSVVVTVSPTSVAGSITGAATVCSGTNSTTLTLAGNTGTIQWQSSSDNVTFNTISGATSSTYTAANLTSTTYYRAVVKSGVCSSATTASVTITVNPASVSGSITGAATVCSGANSTTLTLAGNTGTIQWQSSTDNVTFNTISGATSSTYTAINLTTTTYFRAVVTSGVCSSATTATETITMQPAAVAGSISGGTAVCTGSNNTLLTLSGNTGTIQWQISSDNISFANIAGEVYPTFNAVNLTSTSYYRVVVTSGLCSSATTSSTVISVAPNPVSGYITGEDSVCTGINSTVLTLNSSSGAIQWQQSSDNITFNNIIGATSPTYTAVNLTATTYYKAVVTSGACSAAATISVVMTVDPAAIAGYIVGGGTVCPGTNNTILTLVNNLGTVQWEDSSDNIIFNAITGATSSTYSANNIAATTYYRAVSTSGVCSSVVTSSVAVSISTTTWNGTAWSNGAPTATTQAIFEGNYISSGNINACSITVNSGNVIISSGDDITINGAINVIGGSFTLRNNANLLQNSNAANSGNIIVQRNSSALKRLDYTLWSSPVTGQNLLAFSPLTQATRFYNYSTTGNIYTAIASPSTATFADGQGYLIRMPNNHPAWATVWNGQFSGVPHNGDYTLNMIDAGQGNRFNLVGNPYPSPINMVDFVAANSANITGTLYFWRKSNADPGAAYCTWAAGTFVSNSQAQVADPNGIIRTGQGFFVEGTGAGTAVSFNNSMRSGDNANQFFRSTAVEDRSRIWLNASNDSGSFSQMALVYVNGGITDGLDMYDGKYINDGDLALNSMINAIDYVIQGRAPFVPSDIVPLNFKATTAGNYTISIDHLDGLFTGTQDIFLRDNLTGNVQDLKAGAYTFATQAGTFTNRFDVIYQPLLAVNPVASDSNNVVIYKQGQDLVINTGKAVMTNVKIFDIRGRLLLEKKNISATETKMNTGTTNQVMMVQITTDRGVVTKKVIN